MTDQTPVAASIAVEPLPTKIRTLWRVTSVAVAAVALVAAVAVGVLADSTLLSAALAVAVLVLLALRWFVIDLHYNHWRWGMDEQRIERRQGAIIRRTHIVPRSRVQTITTRTGPIDRWLGLSAIVVHTAGTHTPNLVIPHLEADTVERIRTELGG